VFHLSRCREIGFARLVGRPRGMQEFAGAYGVGGGGYHEPLIQISFFCNFCYQMGPGCKHNFIGLFRMQVPLD
jgi:hypothetical protein